MTLAAPSIDATWVGLRRRATTPEMRLFALPYAGAGASVYRRWVTDLAHADWLDFVAVQLPGRENRATEPPHTGIDAALDELESALSPMLDLPYALVGYSLGALLAYELAIRLTSSGNAPALLVLAARAPSPRGLRSTHPPPAEAVIAKIKRLGGTAPQLIDSPLFESHFLPMLQADFAIADGHHRAVPQILPCPVIAFGAPDDAEVPIGNIARWDAIAGGGFALEQFDGGHFFLHTAHDAVLEVLKRALAQHRPERPLQ